MRLGRVVMREPTIYSWVDIEVTHEGAPLLALFDRAVQYPRPASHVSPVGDDGVMIEFTTTGGFGGQPDGMHHGTTWHADSLVHSRAVLPDEINEDPEPEPDLLPVGAEPYTEDSFGWAIENGETVETDDCTRYRVRLERIEA